jgi:hypothetical protein
MYLLTNMLMEMMMRKLIVLLLVLAFAIPVLAENKHDSHSAVRRYAQDKEDKTIREAVTLIDVGDVAGPKPKGSGERYTFHDWTLLCVDGIKVLTTSEGDSISSIILPGRCDGTYVESKAPELPQNQPKEKTNGKWGW